MPEKNRFPAVLQPVVIDRAAFNQGQNAQYEPHIAESEVMDSLVARGPHAIGQPIPFRKSKRACSTTDNETWVEGDVSNTLNNFDLGDTRTTHAVVNPIAIQGTIIGRGDTAGPQGTGATEGGPMFTLTKTDIHGVCHCSDIAPTHAVVEPICFEPRSQDGHARISGDVSPTLNTAQSGQRQPCVAITFQPGNLRREAGVDPSTTTTTTLKASAGDQMPHVCHPVAGFKWHQGSQAGSIGYENGISPTITTDKSPGVIHPVVPLDGMNLLSRLGECGENHSMQNFTPGDPSFTLKKSGNQHGVLTPMAVRRLTPVECERLQGFPDNWSRISWKGKPEDQCPDGPRYRACGNSMAIPVMRWIGEQIARVEAEGK